jgi:Trk K+ transport system NAD-binding subunit
MNRRQRRVLYYIGGFLGVVVFYTIVYQWAMASFEGETRTITESLLIVVETFTTTGYGEDATVWSSPPLVAIIVAMQFTGVFFLFMAFPLFVAPWLEQTLSTSPPTSAGDVEDHVVICSYTRRNETLTDELDVLGVPYRVVEADRETATELYEADVPVVHGDPESEETLERANVGVARALVADVDDETNASIALTAREVDSEALQIITFVEDPELAEYHRYAGADYVFTPRELVGRSLASKVTAAAGSGVGDAVEIAEDFEVAELLVQPGSELAGMRVADSGIRERTGANIVGAWFRGEFVSPPSPDALIDARTVLLVAGREDQLERLKELTRTEKRRVRQSGTLVCGYGEVGSTVKQELTIDGIDCLAIDIQDKQGVDMVGDATDAEVLLDAGLEDASTIILALSDDTLSIFVTLVIRQIDTEIEIIARANETDSVSKLYQAGADYVLALSTVSGRMLASTILEEDVISFDQQIEVVRMGVGNLVGRSLVGADIRDRTGCTVVAVERDGTVLTDLHPEFTFEHGDTVVVAGPDKGIFQFANLIGEEHARGFSLPENDD